VAISPERLWELWKKEGIKPNMTFVELRHLFEFVYEVADAFPQLDPETVDFQALIDPHLTYEENKSILAEELVRLGVPASIVERVFYGFETPYAELNMLREEVERLREELESQPDRRRIRELERKVEELEEERRRLQELLEKSKSIEGVEVLEDIRKELAYLRRAVSEILEHYKPEYEAAGVPIPFRRASVGIYDCRRLFNLMTIAEKLNEQPIVEQYHDRQTIYFRFPITRLYGVWVIITADASARAVALDVYLVELGKSPEDDRKIYSLSESYNMDYVNEKYLDERALKLIGYLFSSAVREGKIPVEVGEKLESEFYSLLVL